MKEAESRIVQAFNSKFDAISNEVNMLKERVHSCEHQSAEIKAIKDELSLLKHNLNQEENNKIASHICINGVPKLGEENLKDMFEKLCTEVGLRNIETEEIFRLNSKRADTIIVKCSSPSTKHELLKALAAYRKQNNKNLSLRCIGMNSNASFYINERLTKYNYQILQAAIKYRARKKIKSAYSFRGNIYVKREDGRGVLVRSIEELDLLVSSTA